LAFCPVLPKKGKREAFLAPEKQGSGILFHLDRQRGGKKKKHGCRQLEFSLAAVGKGREGTGIELQTAKKRKKGQM